MHDSKRARLGDDRPDAPPIPEGVEPTDLDRDARARLRTLSKANADGIAQHLVMAGRLLEEDPELAYSHAQAAVRRGGRVDIVREAAALTAYATSRYAEALRELRTVRRLSGHDAHRAIEADCERGLGRPARALDVLNDAPPPLDSDEMVERALVEAGARLDLEEPDAALAVLERAGALSTLTAATRTRLDSATHDVLVVLGRATPTDAAAADASGDPGSAGAAVGEGDDDDVLSIEDTDQDPGEPR